MKYRYYCEKQGSSRKEERQLFHRLNFPIQNLLNRAYCGTVLTQSLLCDRITFGQNSLRYITTSSNSLVKVPLT